MANVEKARVALTSTQIASLKHAVETGEYAATSEIVPEALGDWELKHQMRHDEVNRLRQAWDEGIASGPGRVIDFEATRAEGRRRLAATKSGA